MRILIVGPGDQGSRGGMATVIRDLRNSKILNEAFDIDIFSSYVDGNLLKRLAYSAIAYGRFCRICNNYDLIHIHAASYGSTFRKRLYLKRAKRAGKKVIVHIHGAAYLDFYKGLRENRKNMVKTFLQSADMVIGLSDVWKDTFERLFDLENCVSLPNGIDTEDFEKAAGDIAAHKNEFVFLGRLGKRKGAYDLVQAVEIAVRTVPELRIYIAGDGEIEQIRAMIREKKLESHIELLGWIDQQQKLDVLKKSAVLLLPSYNEGLPMAILEAMASGKAIISTTVGAIPEVVKPENGILIAPGDVQALADAIVRLSSDEGLLRRMSERNIQKIDAMFSMKTMHRKLLGYYKKLFE